MKTPLLSLSSLLLCTASLAQIPNGGFENWTPSGTGYDDPDGWITWNVITWSDGSLSCEEGTPGAVGASFAKVTTRNVTGLGVLPGLIFTGDLTAPGFPYDLRPEALNGQYQFNVPAGDGGMISASFTKWNAGTQTQDAVGGGVLSIPPGSQTSWLSFSIPINWITTDYPDTAVVTVMSSTGGGVAGSTVWVDDLSFGDFASISESATYNSFTLTPTADADVLQLTSGNELDEMSFIDLSGRVMSTQQLTSRTATVSAVGLAKGVYVARVRFVNGDLATRVFVRN